MIRIDLLGGLRVSLGATTLDSLPAQRQRCSIVVYLAVEQTVSREALLRLLWPDREPDKARHVLSQNLYELRRDLGEDWIEVRGERLVVTPEVVVDAREFEQRAVDGDERALELYRGPFLGSVSLADSAEFQHWQDGRRAHYSRIQRKLVRDSIATHVSHANLERAATIAQAAAAAEPLEDEFHHSAIDLLARSGKRTEALRHFEIYEKLLREAQLTPLDETIALVADIHAGRTQTAHFAQPVVVTRTGTPAAVEPSIAPPARIRRFRTPALLTAIILAVVLPFTWAVVARDRNAGVLTSSADRVAVLPFEAIGDAGKLVDLEAFRANLINDLSQSKQLTVASRMDVDAQTRTAQPLTATARNTNAVLLIDGSFGVKDSALELSVRFWNGQTGEQISSRVISVPAVRASSDDLRRAVIERVQREAVRMRKIIIYRGQTQDPEALGFFDDGFNRFRSAQELARPPSMDAALRGYGSADSLMALAEAEDPRFLAATMLRIEIAHASGNAHRGMRSDSLAADRAYGTAVRHADRALRNHPTNADALEARGFAKYELWRERAIRHLNDTALRESAQRDLLDALIVEPDRPIARLRLADLFGATGRYREEKEMALRALEADPAAVSDQAFFSILARASLSLRQEQEAANWCRKEVERAPQRPHALYCELTVYAYGDSLKPDVQRARAILQTMRAPANAPFQKTQLPMFEMITAAILARAGQTDSARALAARASAAVPAGTVSLMAPEAALWTHLGEYERALTILELDAAADPAGMLRTLHHAAFKPLHGMPRYQRMLDAIIRSN